MEVALGWRTKAAALAASEAFQRAIVALILVNGVVLGLETSDRAMAAAGPLLERIDHFILGVFVVEIALRLAAAGRRFFAEPWNVFDFAVVAIALVPASGPLSVLRVLRVLRILRLVSAFPRMRFVVEALLKAIPGIVSIAGLMLLLFYVFAVMATGFFGNAFPQWFGSIGGSMYTLFQIMTLESWSMGIVRPVMEVYPFAWMFFVPFILIATFTILNLFIAIIVNTMESMHQQEHLRDRRSIESTVHIESEHVWDEVRALRREIGELKTLVSKRRAGDG